MASLIDLLDDSDDEIASAAMHRLCSAGVSIIPDLEQAWQECIEELRLIRIEHVIGQIQSKTTLHKLKEWVDTGATELLPGAFYMAKLLHPEVAYDPLAQMLEGICRDIWIELNSYLTALEKVSIINQVLFGKYKFCHNASLIDNAPEQFLIDNLLQKKIGNCLALSTLYLCVAEKLKLPIKGLDMPRSLMLAYLDEHYNDEHSLFYIYPFLGGQVLGKQQLELIVNRTRINESDQHIYLHTCSNQAHILSLAKSLQDIFTYNRQHEQAKKVRTAIKILSRKPATSGQV